MASEQFSLCWDNFHKNMSAGLQSLLENEDLVDVTLAVEGRYLKAHKMVLSVCSPYFRELFQSNPCKHPIVFMKDVSYIALSDLLQFMYQGEVQVSQENLSTFIKTAESLQIKGLTGDGMQDSDITEHIETERKVVEIPAKRVHGVISSKPASQLRMKKSVGPVPKRPRISATAAEVAAITTIATSTPVAMKRESETVQLKMEPSEGGSEQTLVEERDESQVEKYIESMDNGQDDSEDYHLMEASIDEPKAGTSTHDPGNSQEHNPKKSPMDDQLSSRKNAPELCGACEKNAATSEKIMNMVVQLCSEVQKVNSTLSNIQSFDKTANDNVHAILDNLRKRFPMKSEEEVLQFEEDLCSDEVLMEFRKFCSLIGGTTFKDNIHRIFRQLFTNEFASKCSWFGKRNNISVAKYRCIKEVKVVVMNVHPNFTESDYERVAGEWFRFAKQRQMREIIKCIKDHSEIINSGG